MSNFKEDILERLDDERVEGVVFGGDGWRGLLDCPQSMEPHPPEEMLGRRLAWDEAAPWFDREYDDGFGGGAGCYAICVWTPTRVLFVSEYDGSTTVCAVPRHPIEHYTPYMPGGG